MVLVWYTVVISPVLSGLPGTRDPTNTALYWSAGPGMYVYPGRCGNHFLFGWVFRNYSIFIPVAKFFDPLLSVTQSNWQKLIWKVGVLTGSRAIGRDWCLVIIESEIIFTKLLVWVPKPLWTVAKISPHPPTPRVTLTSKQEKLQCIHFSLPVFNWSDISFGTTKNISKLGITKPLYGSIYTLYVHSV